MFEVHSDAIHICLGIGGFDIFRLVTRHRNIERARY